MELLRRLSLTILLIALVGCGGGSLGSDDGNVPGEGDTPVTTVTLTLSESTVSDLTPVTVSATVKTDGSAVSGQLVTFTLNNSELATFSPEVGTAITDDGGVATITLKAGGTEGSGQITASAKSVEAIIAFTSKGDGNVVGVPVVADISLFASSQQLSSSGSNEITLIALAKDADNNLMENITVQFSSTSGQVEIVNATTGKDGKASAILKTNNEYENRTITASVVSGAVSDSFEIQVVGTTVSLTGSSSLAIDDANTFIVKVLDSDGVGIGGVDVALTLANTPSGSFADITFLPEVTTDVDGQATVLVTGTTGGTNTIVAAALGATISQTVSVQADRFLFTNFNDGNGTDVDPSASSTLPDVLLSKTALITLSWTRSGVAVPDGTKVEFSATRGVLNVNSATTVAGEVTVEVTSSNAGKSLISFKGTDGAIVLNNQIEFEFVAETVETISAQASPSSIGPDGQTSTISIVVKDLNGNLVKNKTIDFTLTDTNGGTIFPASAVTNSNGGASTVFTSRGISAKDGVSVVATVKEDPTKKAEVTLTVSERGLFISLGTGNTLIQSDATSYNKQYTVFVTDIDSIPVENVIVKVSAIPHTYKKGFWIKTFDLAGSFKSWVAVHQDGSSAPFGCINEDSNLDGILDVGEDINNNGKLTPGNVVAAVGEVVTDEKGQGIVDIVYAESYGHWVDVNLIFSATVNGTEGSASTIFTLPVLANDVIDEDVLPATIGVGANGPFGRLADCTTID
jgi:hypothetical protein